MEEVWIPIFVVSILFLALPWLVLHYVTKWKVNSGLTAEDETMLDDLYDLARRLDDRMLTIERIVQDENPQWNALTSDHRGPPQLEKSDIHDLGPRREVRSNAPDLAKHGRA
jgi:phage shock protein B